ncbi:MAG: neutral zinc metallopeptidase [Lysobacterales bacterium 69-70]|mgnify:CR=1 FL=1|nr:zinc metallopeptidase [Xanthomonadaceae bacterium]ODU31505.1 MAG: metallopeptidase [Xanthomonadaceae bacterium SCN 69-320]ODV17003.1 MAG: metallopeptidase [Xanthomonadaceae bacterium SCN 69-25]OJY95718.1 MAG: neutral zinc metallopeptidase [Xanthomonadales bacterium 69-70]
MLWQKGRRSDNVVSADGGGGPRRLGGGPGLGIGGIIIVFLISWALGKNPLEILSLLSQGDGGPAPQAQTERAPEATQTNEFVRAVLGSTEDVWSQIYRAAGGQYKQPRLVLFQGGVNSACGMANSAVGPFYCPGDQQVYLDTSFFDELSNRFKASGDFARAYVIAHEVGHHVQNLMGVMRKTEDMRRRGAPMEGADGLSVRQELQADCFAGVWANQAQRQLQWLEAGDVESALAAATAIGDDKLQKQARGYVVPDSFTHGSSAQRVRWFRQGFQRGDVNACDTFGQQPL